MVPLLKRFYATNNGKDDDGVGDTAAAGDIDSK